MPLAPGTRLGPYEIVVPLGTGGMGEVYRARDTKLNRDVAIKVLPEAFAIEPERLARFTREAQTLAVLNHPNIAHIHGLEDSGGVRALVMELVEGEDLSQRLARGPVPLDEAVSIARQLGEALEAAHEQGIVHRDLKPANIKVRPDGTVKVLDFGLAKAVEQAQGSGLTAQGGMLANSPTLTAHATQMGVILGTAAYMAPEQASGKLVDRRADIWAFGVVLWEMMTGRRLFEGESVPETLGAIFRQEIDLEALPAETPPAVRHLLARCLERDPKLRLRDIGEARIALADVRSSPRPHSDVRPRVAAPVEATPPPARSRMTWIPWTIAAIAVAVASWLMLRPSPESVATTPAHLVVVGVSPPAGHVLAAGETPALDVARDGSAAAFEAEGPNGRQIFLRRLDRAGVEPVPSTLGGAQPFFSPDGRSLAFFADGRIRKIALDSRAVADIVGVNSYRGATWADGGWIVYTQSYSDGLQKVRDTGGRPEPVTSLDRQANERSHRWPTALPGSPWVLFTVGVSKSPNYWDDSRIDAVNLETGERKTIFDGAWMARFAPPDTLLLQRGATLFGLPFDRVRAERRGSERVVLENVGGEASSGAGYFAPGGAGILAYVPAGALIGETGVAIVEPSGAVTKLSLPEKRYWYPRFSPDGRSLLLDIGSGQSPDDEVWRYDFASGQLSRVTFVAGSALPVWSPDGAWVAYTGGSPGRVNSIFRKRIDGASDEERVWTGNDLVSATDWTRDGRSLIAMDLRGG